VLHVVVPQVLNLFALLVQHYKYWRGSGGAGGVAHTIVAEGLPHVALTDLSRPHTLVADGLKLLVYAALS
jgi:hypothetical protein